MRVLVTGANGFLGKNLSLRLSEIEGFEVVSFTKDNAPSELPALLATVDCVVHLAGINRPERKEEFIIGNTNLTESLCAAIKESGRTIPVVYTSSIQAALNNDYGITKLACEEALLDLKKATGNPVTIFRLPNVFGKWARPNYNSVVATFCYNIARDIPIHINDPSATVQLVYVDDVIDSFVSLIKTKRYENIFDRVEPEYSITISELAQLIDRFKTSRGDLITERVGVGFTRALYATYMSYLPAERFSYSVHQNNDSRGLFVEMLKTVDSGQFSFFTALPGVTRGGHYHHSKTEKFLVIKGKARFRFRHVCTSEFYELITSGDKSEVVETVPGWTHDITNIGDDELICMLWANEIFDRDKPDTIACPVKVSTSS